MTHHPSPPEGPPIRREHLDTVDSTNDAAKRAIERGEIPGETPRLITATTQTAGRGRGHHRWASPPGGLWATLAWPARLSPPAVLDALGLRLGLALTRAVDRLLSRHPDPARLKWPNDVMTGGKKIAGALTEIFVVKKKTWILVGCGVNTDLALEDLPEHLRATSTTLEHLLGRDTHTQKLLPALEAELAWALQTEGLAPDTLAEIRSRLYGIGNKTVIRRPGTADREGTLIGIEPDGSAVFTAADGTRFTAPTGAEILPADP